MRSSAPLSGRVASGGCWRDDAAMREVRSHRVANIVTAQPHTLAQPQDGSSILHQAGHRPRRRDQLSPEPARRLEGRAQ
jgi:hypothetical protein